MNLEERSQYKETLLHEQPGFVHNTYLCIIPQDSTRLDLHWHNQMKIIYVKKERSAATASPHRYPVMAGSIMPILPGGLHAISGDPDVRMEHENIMFLLSFLDNQVENNWARRNILTSPQMGTLCFPHPVYVDTAMHAEVSTALDAADDACSRRSDDCSPLVCSSLFRFIFALYTHWIREESLPPSPYEDVIKQVLLYVQNHFSKPITVSDVTSLIDYSGARFMRVFRRETKFTFGEYPLDYRSRCAPYLLKGRPDSVGAIVSLYGFDNSSYLIWHFHHKYGMSPREYRSRGRQNTKNPQIKALYNISPF